MPGCTRRHQAHQDTFSLHVSATDAGQDAKEQFHGSFQKNGSDLKKVKAPVSHGRAGGKLLEYYFEALGLLSADQSTMKWLGTDGQELKMVQKDVLRGWHGTCNVEGNWNELDQNEASRRNARRFRSYFRHDSVVPGGDSSKLVSILTVIEREVARGAARQNAHHVKSVVGVPKNRDGMTMC